MVLRAAYRLGLGVLPGRAGGRDFTPARLFACLVLSDFYGLSYRRTEALLRDSPQWLADIGMPAAPDHNTLWRASGTVVTTRRVNRMLDLLAARFARARLLRLSREPLALDSTCFEQRHRSAHYDRRCRQMQSRGAAARRRRRRAARTSKSLGKSRAVGARRSTRRAGGGCRRCPSCRSPSPAPAT
jgi:hypothetical protein